MMRRSILLCCALVAMPLTALAQEPPTDADQPAEAAPAEATPAEATPEADQPAPAEVIEPVIEPMPAADEPAPAVSAEVEAAPAEDAIDPDSIPTGTVVTAARTATPISETPQSITVITREKLDREQARTAAEALRDQPGIWIQQTGHIGGAPILRGLMGNQILLMVDGIRLNNVALFSGPNSFLQTLDIEDTERIEVVRGAGSVLHGTDALGGVVNVITSDPGAWALPEEGWIVGGMVKTTFGSNDAQRRLRVEGTARGNTLRARFGVTAQKVGDPRGGGDIGVMHPGGWSEMNIDARLDWRPATGHMFSVGFWRLTQDDIQRFDTYLGNNAASSDRSRHLASLSYRTRAIKDSLGEVTARTYFQDQRSSDSNLLRADVRDNIAWTVGADLQLERHLGDSIKLTYGAHYHHDDATSTRDKDGTITHPSPDATWDNAAAFALAAWTPVERLTVSLSGRWDYYLFKTDPDITTTPEGLDVDELRLDVGQSAPNGALSVVGRVTDWLNLVGHVGTAFRAPNTSDTVSSGPFTLGYNVPSPGVGPERAISAEAGVRVAHKVVRASASYFYTHLNGLIDSVPGSFNGADYIDANGNGMRDAGEDVFVKGNANSSYLHGVEASFEVNPAPQWTLFGQGTWLDGENEKDGVKSPLDRGTPTNGSLGARWSPPGKQRWWVETSASFVATFDASRIPDDRITRDAAFKVNPQDSSSPLLSGDGSVPGYWLWNARAGATLNDWASIRLTANNLLNVEYRAKDSRLDGLGLNVIGSLVLQY